MAKFRQYNIQLLPLDTMHTAEVGIAGYKRLFELFKDQSADAYKKKRMANDAMPLANDSYICPFVIHIEQKFAYGSFIKFHKAETVTEFYTQERLFQAAQGTTAVSNKHYFRFIFDFEYHRFAIEEGGNRLPSTEVMRSTLEHFLQKIANHHFPKHVLTLNLVSDDRSLREVLASGNEFGAVQVRIAFPNSHRLTAALKELKDSNAHSVSASVAPARGARMTAIPTYIRELVTSASEFGEAKVVFFRRLPAQSKALYKKMFYSTTHHPLWMSLRQKKNEEEFEFMKRTWMNLKALVQRDAN